MDDEFFGDQPQEEERVARPVEGASTAPSTEPGQARNFGRRRRGRRAGAGTGEGAASPSSMPGPGGPGGRRRRSGPPSGAPAGPRPRPVPGVAMPEPEAVKPVRELLQTILEKMGVPQADVAYIPRSEGEYLEVRGPDLANLIGRHGHTLEALNLIFNNIVNVGVRNNRRYYTIDAEGYRARRADQLKGLALETLERAVRERKPIVLEPMLPSERKVIHLALSDSPFVTTESSGAEPDRRVVVTPK